MAIKIKYGLEKLSEIPIRVLAGTVITMLSPESDRMTSETMIHSEVLIGIEIEIGVTAVDLTEKEAEAAEREIMAGLGG